MFFPALFQGIERPYMTRVNMFVVSVQETFLEFADDGGEQNHLTPPHLISILFTRLLMVRDVFFLVLEVRWVYFEVVRTLTWPRICCSSMRSTPASSRWVA
jgi:hypothetical protein